jgi:hypothetical protein
MVDHVRLQMFSDPRFEDLVAEALIGDKFLFSLRRGDKRGEYIVEFRSEEFVSGACVEEVPLDVLLNAIERAKHALRTDG